MLIQKLLAVTLTATLAVGGMGVALKNFEINNLEKIKSNYTQVEKLLKENEVKLVDKYNKLYVDATTSIKSLESEKAELKSQIDKLQLKLNKVDTNNEIKENKPVEDVGDESVNVDNKTEETIIEEVVPTPNIEENQTINVEEVPIEAPTIEE